VIARVMLAALAAVLLLPTPSPEVEIATAVLPLPAPMRDGAAVVRLDSAFRPILLRRGTNGMVCIADRPGDDDFDVRCYRDVFIDVVYRGFQLHHAGVKGKEAGARIDAEIKAGTLKMTRETTAGYRCLGPIAALDTIAITTGLPIKCWESVHFPYRTAAEIGFPVESQVTDSMRFHVPYVMASGTYWSHVMIEHP